LFYQQILPKEKDQTALTISEDRKQRINNAPRYSKAGIKRLSRDKSELAGVSAGVGRAPVRGIDHVLIELTASRKHRKKNKHCRRRKDENGRRIRSSSVVQTFRDCNQKIFLRLLHEESLPATIKTTHPR